MRSLIQSRLARSFSQSLHHVAKFYKDASVLPYHNALSPSDSGFTVKLDKKTLSTADGHKYFLQSESLAHLVALEFLAQKDYIVSSSMPLVRLEVTTSSDSRKVQSISSIVLCYSSTRLPDSASLSKVTPPGRFSSNSIRDPNPKLRAWQEERADPLVKLFAKKFGVQLRAVTSRLP